MIQNFEWVHVSKDLPDPDIEVLVSCGPVKNRVVAIAELSGTNGDWLSNSFIKPSAITHWAYIPEGPTK